MSNPDDLLASVAEFYTPCDDIKRLCDLCTDEARPYVKLVADEERLLSDLLDTTVSPWPGSFLLLARIPTNIPTLGDELNIDLAVNAIVEHINGMLSKYSGNQSLIRCLIQYRLNSLIRCRRVSAAYLLLLSVFLTDQSRCFTGTELVARRLGQCSNSTLLQFCPPQMICQLLTETKTHSFFFSCLSSFNLIPASFVQRLNLYKWYVTQWLKPKRKNYRNRKMTQMKKCPK